MRQRLKSVSISGYKSIRSLVDFEPGSLTVLIGANGAGKSNLLSFFKMLSWSLASPGQLQEFLGRHGGAGAVLHDGPERTRDLTARLTLETPSGDNDYAFRLALASGDVLIYTEEKFRFARRDWTNSVQWTYLDSGHREARLLDNTVQNTTARTILSLLRRLVSYQFHNTSSTARMRGKWHVDDSRYLKEDAGNLGAFLMRLQQQSPVDYRRIVDTVRQALPFFADFELSLVYDSVLLQWREVGSDVIFSAGQAADGMLRFIALVALLMQPEDNLPDVLILDEPELGLHPFAIEILSELIRAASRTIQVIVATQSVSLIDRFDPESVVVVERRGRESMFQRLDPEAYRSWLEEYSVSELWEKNVIGGRPAR
ncbi:MAG: AAA family ATPase [Bryobacteraceae bacterium]|nr:AAA family ATPase [Bryobacteraceae bacterium]